MIWPESTVPALLKQCFSQGGADLLERVLRELTFCRLLLQHPTFLGNKLNRPIIQTGTTQETVAIHPTFLHNKPNSSQYAPRGHNWVIA